MDFWFLFSFSFSFWPFLFLFVRSVLCFFPHSSAITAVVRKGDMLSVFLASPQEQKGNPAKNKSTHQNYYKYAAEKTKKKKYLFPWTMSSHHFSFELYRYTYICVCVLVFSLFLQIKSTKCLMEAHSQVTINHHPIQWTLDARTSEKWEESEKGGTKGKIIIIKEYGKKNTRIKNNSSGSSNNNTPSHKYIYIETNRQHIYVACSICTSHTTYIQLSI